MPYSTTVYRVLLASPSDVVDERRAIPAIIDQWNRDNAFSLKTTLETVKWETHCTPEMGDRPQEIVNRQVVRDCDILIGVFWTRLGSPTGKEESGTVEEIQEFIATGKPVLLYFSRMPVQPDSIDQEQWKNLKRFQGECMEKGLVYFYESIDDLRDLIRPHLSRTLQILGKKNGNTQSDTNNASQESKSDRQKTALASFASEFKTFLRRANADWSSERDSQPYSTEDAKLLLGRITSELVHYRSRITNDTGHISKILAEATTRLKALQRHQVFLDGGRSFNAFWTEGDEIFLLLEMVPALLNDALADDKTIENGASLIRATISELEYNQKNLRSPEYNTPAVLQNTSMEALLAANLELPESLLADIQAYIRNLRAAREVQRLIAGQTGEVMPEVIKIEELLETAKVAGEAALKKLRLFWECRYKESFEPASQSPSG